MSRSARILILAAFLLVVIVATTRALHAQDGILSAEQLQQPGVHLIYAWDTLHTQLIYIAGPNDSGAIQLAGYQNGVSSPSFQRSTVEEIRFQSLPTNDRVTAAFEIQVVRNIELTRNIEFDFDGFSFSNLAGLLESGDQLAAMFEQLAQNVVDIMEARDVTCLGTISDNNVLTFSC